MANQGQQELWLETPLIKSTHISSLLGCNVYLKLENLQPSQSFKYRGISLFAQHCKDTHGESVHLIIASGGNAGLAAACAANMLGLRCTVYIPLGASAHVLNCLRKEGAEVVVIGQYYLQALRKVQEAVEADSNAVMVPAYDHHILWKGHSAMIEEISRQLPGKPDAIFCSVGGGGLLGGVITGCRDVDWDDVPVVALETQGCDCFYHSIGINQSKWQADAPLPDGITATTDIKQAVKVAHVSKLVSKASSLGATSPSPSVVKMALHRPGGITCVTVPDEMSMQASVLFAEDHKFIVELACSTTLVPAYKPALFSRICSLIDRSNGSKSVVFIICGGTKISLEDIEEYRQIVNIAVEDDARDWSVRCNGEVWNIAL